MYIREVTIIFGFGKLLFKSALKLQFRKADRSFRIESMELLEHILHAHNKYLTY